MPATGLVQLLEFGYSQAKLCGKYIKNLFKSKIFRNITIWMFIEHKKNAQKIFLKNI